jgi:predicted nuclease with TOPRIM domain
MRGEIMDNRRDILKSEITKFQQRLGIKVIITRNLKSIEDCRKALVEITKHYASISQGNLGLDTEVDILRKKVKVLQEEKVELEKTNQVYSNDIKILQNTTKNLREDREDLIEKNNILYSVIDKLNNKKWWQFWR